MAHSRAHVWWLALRPKTLTAAFVPVAVGTAFVVGHGRTANVMVVAAALASAFAIQIGTNLFNDVLDFEKGTDRADRLGPLRVTQQGLVSPRAVYRAASLSFGLAAVFCVPLVWIGGWPVAAIAGISLICGYGYTGGPLPLSYHGLGEVFVLIFFGLIAVGGTVYLQAPDLWWQSWPAGFQVGFLATVLIAINNLRDIEQDTISGKRTIAVRAGVSGARAEILALVLLAYLFGGIWLVRSEFGAAFFPSLTLPLAGRILCGVLREAPSAKYNRFLAQSAGLHLLFGALLCAGLVWGR